MSLRRCQFLKRLAGLAVTLGVMAALSRQIEAQTTATTSYKPTSLYELKALCLLRIAKYTEWPTEVLGDENAPFVLGILGDDPFGKDIGVIQGKTIKGRKLTVKRFAKLQEVTGCHVLFICSSETKNLPRILKALENSSILTIADVEGFVEQSGMINLVAEQRTAGTQSVRFEINRAAAEKANLKLDTQLLKLAKWVKS